jgi:phosphoribosylformylglycinamidine synthase
LADAELLHSARDISDGGIAVTLAEGCFARTIGVRASMHNGVPSDPVACWLFAENASEVIISCAPSSVEKIKTIADDFGSVTVVPLGETIADRLEIGIGSNFVISESISNLHQPWLHGLANALESTFHLEPSHAGEA